MKFGKAVIGWTVSICLSAALAAGQAEDKTDNLIKGLMETHRVPGLAYALMEGGKVVERRTYGFAKLEEGQPLDADTVMYGASLTKLVFAVYLGWLPAGGLGDVRRCASRR